LLGNGSPNAGSRSNRGIRPLLGNGSVSTFQLQRINTEKQNKRETVRHGDLYSFRPEVIKELVQFIQEWSQDSTRMESVSSEPSFGIRHS
jgi:hypothetical protein